VDWDVRDLVLLGRHGGVALVIWNWSYARPGHDLL
jgi:hypothetical protein